MEYCPEEFKQIRETFGVEKIFSESFEQRVENRVTHGGASNALFFFSACNRFIAKSCTAEEMMCIRKKDM